MANEVLTCQWMSNRSVLTLRQTQLDIYIFVFVKNNFESGVKWNTLKNRRGKMEHPLISEPMTGRIMTFSEYVGTKWILIVLKFNGPRFISSWSNVVTIVKFSHFRYIRDVIAALCAGK